MIPIEADNVSCVVNHGPSNFSIGRVSKRPRVVCSNIRIGGVPGGSPGSSWKCSNMVVVVHAVESESTPKCHRRSLFGAALGSKYELVVLGACAERLQCFVSAMSDISLSMLRNRQKRNSTLFNC